MSAGPNEQLLDELQADLQQAGLRHYGTRRTANALYVLYDEVRVDHDKLLPICRKYQGLFHNRSIIFPNVDEVSAYGFTPENVGAEKWEYLALLGREVLIFEFMPETGSNSMFS